MQELQHMTVQALCDLAASDQPVPGGGSMASMSGAYGAALAQMMCKLTLNRDKYREVEARMQQLDAQLEQLRQAMLMGITKDTLSYAGFMEAMRLPKDTDEQKATRRAAMQQALKGACAVPLQNAQDALAALALAVEVVKLGNLNTLSDGLVGALMLRTAALGGINNVRINLPGIQDEAYRRDMEALCDKLQARALSLEQQAMDSARDREDR